MATTFLNQYPLEAVPMSWPIYTGAQVRPVVIPQGDRALATSGNLLKRGRPPLPSVIKPFGNRLSFRSDKSGADNSVTIREVVAEWIAPGGDRSAELVLYDVRWFLRRARMRADINRRMRDGRYVDRFERFEEVVDYMMQLVREDTGRPIVTRYAPDGIRSEDLPDDIYTAGMTVADALDAAMGAVVATCFVDTEGRLTFQRLAAGGNVEDTTLQADKWVTKPSFEKPAIAPTAPSRVTVLYQRELEKFVGLLPRTLSPTDTQPYLQQVYQIDGEWLTAEEFERWYLVKTNSTIDLRDDTIRQYWNKGNMAGLFFDLDTIGNEAEKAVIAAFNSLVVKALEQWWRRAFRIVNASEDTFASAVQVGAYRRDEDNNITGVDGTAVYCNWIGFYQVPVRTGKTLDGAITAISHPEGPAPFAVAYDPEARVLALTPTEGASQFAVTVLGSLVEDGKIGVQGVETTPDGFADTLLINNLRSLEIARDYELNIYYLTQPLDAENRWHEVTPGGQGGEQTITIISNSFLARETDGGFLWTEPQIERDAKRWADLIRLAETARSGSAEAHGVQLLKRFTYFRNGLNELRINMNTLGSGSLTVSVDYGPSRQIRMAQQALKRAARTEAIDTGDLRP